MKYYIIILLLLLLTIFCTFIPKNDGFTSNDFNTAQNSMKPDSNNYNSANFASFEYSNFDVSLNLLNQPSIYYTPGSFTYSSNNYIPEYEESVYLSNAVNKTLPRDIYANTQDNSKKN